MTKKELSIEQKAQRYDEAIKRANAAHKDEDRHLKATLERIFPELAESEDERIRKALIDGFTVMKESKNCGKTFSNHNIPVTDILAWLEKQGNNINCIYDKELSELLHIVICRYVNDPDISYIERENVSKKIFPYVELLEKQGEKEDATKDKIAEYLKKLILDQSQRGAHMLDYEGRIEEEVDFIISVAKKELKNEKQGEHTIACSEEQMKMLKEILTFAANHEHPYWNSYIFETLNDFIKQLQKLKA